MLMAIVKVTLVFKQTVRSIFQMDQINRENTEDTQRKCWALLSISCTLNITKEENNMIDAFIVNVTYSKCHIKCLTEFSTT